MKRRGTLLNKKYNALLVATLAMTASNYLAGIFDGIMVGRILGTMELYAINLTTAIIFLRSIPIALFTFGGNTLSVYHKSQRDSKSANIVFTLSFWAGVLISVLISGVGISLLKPTAMLLAQGKEELAGLVMDYLLPLWILTPLVAVVNQTAAYARTDGHKEKATMLPIVSNVVNLICDYIYMALFGWGIAGAGWATITGYAVGVVMSVLYLRSDGRTVHFTKDAITRLKALGEIFRVGLPSALIYVCSFIRLFFTNAIILSFTGIMGGKIASVSFSLNSLAFIFVEGASMTLLPILGALYGEKDVNGQRLTLRYGMIFSIAISLGVFIISELFPVQLAMLYGMKDPEIIQVFAVTFRIVSLNIPILAVIYVMRSFFQATKQEKLANLIVILDGALAIVPLMFWFAHYNIYWLWASFPVSKLVTVAITLIAMLISWKTEHKQNILGIQEQDCVLYDFSAKKDINQVIKASQEAQDFCEKNNVPKRTANAVGVTVEELCHNIVDYSQGSSDAIDVCIRIFPEMVNVRLRDDGVEFDPTNYLDDSGKRITGLKLARMLSSSIDYNRVLGFNVTNIAINY
ncbi:Na+-driven multidrug efflux pump [Pseudobutyrivibrio sp. ACV-2]|uniref:MATE family efflux transporter n=1 Tax=Pseudobutyrivibrio sp. ACV-2 TaxID=1520801 RepID=UPI00089C79AB|nr:MATE family efflux transporter [Pseudobutyrivibrio sp. ACV-2]SEA50005.1 Na+-driven multidrug efflux pump [Pseudobutyrivibrio sp. ACV-2]